VKRSTITVLVFLGIFFVATFVRAQEGKGPMQNQGHKRGMMHDRMGKDSIMQAEMLSMMMPKQMVASNDGGVIVLAGKNLYKYDKNLVLVKEAEIKVDAAAMKKMMGGEPACSMMQHGEKGKMAEDAAASTGDMDMGAMPMPEK
jgi:hypothetical protein